MKLLKILGLLCLVGTLGTSCVSMKKYRTAKVQMLRYEQEIDILMDQAVQLREQNIDLEAQVKTLREQANRTNDYEIQQNTPEIEW